MGYLDQRVAEAEAEKLQAAFAQEMARCKADFWYFAERHVRIYPKPESGQSETSWLMNRSAVGYRPYDFQRKGVEILLKKKRMFWLKARQTGATTTCNAFFLWMCLFYPNTSHAIVAHREETATVLFRMLMEMYNMLDPLIKELVPVKRSREGDISFGNGSQIRVSASSSPKIAGGTLSSLHLSEFGLYENPARILEIALPAVGRGFLVLETTGDEGRLAQRDYWTQDNGLAKYFVPWFECPDYVADMPKEVAVDAKIVEYADKWNLDKGRVGFMYRELRARNWNWPAFHRNYPAQPDDAFSLSGEKFFTRYFNPEPWAPGIMVYEAVQPMASYVMGVDAAAGTEFGDYSSFAILRVDKGEVMAEAATFMARVAPRELATLVLEFARKYQPVVNIEVNNGWGLAALEALIEGQYGRLYAQKSVDAVSGEASQRIGWQTTERTRPLLLEYVRQYVDAKDDRDRYVHGVRDLRLQAQCNTFERNANGKYEHQKGAHDDMVFAYGLALAATDQAPLVHAVSMSRRPRTYAEQLAFYQTHLRHAGPDDVFDDDPVQKDSALHPLFRDYDGLQ